MSSLTASLNALNTSTVTGVRRSDSFVAVRLKQGARTVYAVQLPLEDVSRVLPVPDPQHPTPGNRKVDAKHATDFGKYVRRHPEWVAPPLLVRDNGKCTFTKQLELPGGIEVGILEVPHGAVLKIVDGQHRVLGLHDATAAISREEDELLEQLARAKGRGADTSELDEKLAELAADKERFATEHLGVYVYEEGSPDAYEQMFFDVADNALGIRQAVKVRFDNRKLINRTFDPVAKHKLLQGRVDVEQDRITGGNQNLLGAKHVIEIVRSVNVGVMGRITKKREAELDDESTVENAMAFLDSLVDGFPDLAAVADGTLTPPTLRTRSLTGSLTMLRVLAGVFHNLVLASDDEDETWTPEQVAEFFGQLAPHMEAPVAPTSVWLTAQDFDPNRGGVPDFTRGAYGPQARSQNIKHLTEVITDWAWNGVPA
ncbi:DNA sulfur modification protein DndB [Vallicoccus soli]|uniref:DGQHR domain-containing protein n=1 Tax=Vallicoccus soli TaxID=2339232 RepID=A0A3A3YPL9_9ACTN|nr:DNA sulfur modification protein DndB [Vallicoccus soli]RJK92515.1 hypothetical protein D5H78_18735 [Vallicoccus soli]